MRKIHVNHYGYLLVKSLNLCLVFIAKMTPGSFTSIKEMTLTKQ